MSFMKQMDFFGEGALDAIRSNWRTTIENEGGRCPCCDRFGKINAHSMIETMALALLWLSRQPTDEQGFVDVTRAPAWFVKGKYSLLRHWDLTQKTDKPDDKTKGEGLWMLTSKGQQFLRGQISIPKKVYIYDNCVQGFSSEEIYFCDTFGKHFVYAEVMSDSFNLASISI